MERRTNGIPSDCGGELVSATGSYPRSPVASATIATALSTFNGPPTSCDDWRRQPEWTGLAIWRRAPSEKGQ